LFALFLVLLFSPNFSQAQIIDGNGPSVIINCGNFTSELSPISKSICDKIAQQLSTQCQSSTTTFAGNKCTVKVMNCTIQCAVVNNYLQAGLMQYAAENNIKSNDASSQAVPQMDNPISSVSSPQILIGKIINAILGVVGSIALIMFIYGGFTWMTAGGNAEGTKKGREIIVWSALGLAVIFLSYGLVKFLILSIK